MFQNRPPLPKYQETWDVDVVLKFLADWQDAENLSLQRLTYKTVMLLALLTGQRGQSLHNLKVDDVRLYQNKCVLVFSALLKQSRPGVHLKPINLDRFHNPKLCVVSHVKEYIKKTRERRKGQQLFISYVAPFKSVSRDTISRWIKIVLQQAGVDVEKFSPHSTRSASTSAMYNRGASLDSILQAAGWSTDSTFKKFYLKSIQPSVADDSGAQDRKSLSQSVLDSFIKKQTKTENSKVRHSCQNKVDIKYVLN